MELKLAMWSGPRNISTALMRSFENRTDAIVCDEPLYAHYLLEHGHDHPGREEILEVHDSNLDRVVEWLTGPLPAGQSVFYQKHMTHHLTPDVPREWISKLTNCFLIREPREMLTSLIKVLPGHGLLDTGMPQQEELFERVEEQLGHPPPVIDSADVLDDPPRLLARLCEAVGLDFDDAMLSWPPGRRDSDGVWARHWYGAVEKSTGFKPYQSKNEDVAGHLGDVQTECERIYDRLYEVRLH